MEAETNEPLTTSTEKISNLQFVEITLERQSNNSEIKPIAVRDDEIENLDTDSKN